MKGQKKKLERQRRQEELLKNFEGDFYQEKRIGDEWYVKSYNGGTGRWQVSIYSLESYRKYKSFQENKDLDDEFEEKIIDSDFVRPTLESIQNMAKNGN